MKFVNASPPVIFLILGAWLLLNLIQATFTELFHDEALFWVYSYRLDWGYWDHAPMIGLLTKWGTMLFPGREIGVRLFPVLLNTLSFYLVYLIVEKKDPLLLFAIIFSLVISHAAGFFAAPDAPLAFFVTLFFYLYKQYLEKDTILLSLFLALTVSMILYSKYHGAMILFFTILAYPAILKRKTFWLIVAVALTLYIPHLIWLNENGYATFKHHLVNRSDKPYHLESTLNYLYSQLLFYGPLLGIIVFPAAWLYKVKNRFERTLKFCLWGVMGLLFMLSFNGHVEANWSAVAFLPLVVLSFNYISKNTKWRTWTYRLAIPSIVLFFALRIILIVEFVPAKGFMNQFSGWKNWAHQIQELADGHPVVFVNGFQLPSKYSFYTQSKPPLVLNNYKYHQTQFDLWDLEKDLQGEKVLFVRKEKWEGFENIEIPITGVFSYKFIEDFRSFNKIKIEVLKKDKTYKAGTLTTIPVRLYNRYDYPVEIKKFKEYSFYFNVQFRQKGKWLNQEIVGPPIENLSIEDFTDTQVSISMPDEAGKYKMYLSLATNWLYQEFSANGHPVIIEVVE